MRVADAHGLTGGIDDLSGHIAGAHAFMPGVALEQRGTNVVRFAPGGPSPASPA